MDGERNESEEPKSVPQEQIREITKASEDFIIAEKAQLDAAQDVPFDTDPGVVLDELGSLDDMQVELPDNPLSAPTADTPTQQANELFTPPETPRPPGAILPPRTQSPAASQPSPSRQPLRKQTYSQTKAAQKAARVAGLQQAMQELAQNVAQQVPDAQPVNPAEMPRGEAERLVFPGGEQRDGLNEAYREYMTEDKEWRSTLAKLLREHAGELRQSRLELDRIRCLLEQDRI